jgi:hypothetical protein
MQEATLSSLRAFPQQLQRFYDAVPAGYVHWTPASWEGIPSETFTAIEQICHVRDIEIDGYHVRFRRLLELDQPELESIDGYQLAIERRYAEASASDVFEAIRRAREKTVALLESLDAHQWTRRGYFEGYGHVTVKSLAHYLCSHDQQHLAGIQWLLGQIDSNNHQ